MNILIYSIFTFLVFIHLNSSAGVSGKIFAGSGPENGHLYEEGESIVITKETKYIVANEGAKLSFQLDAYEEGEKIKEEERHRLLKKDTGKDEFRAIYHTGADTASLSKQHIKVFAAHLYKVSNIYVDINGLKSEHEGEYYYAGDSGKSEIVKVVIGDPMHPTSSIVGQAKESVVIESEGKTSSSERATHGDQTHRVHEDLHMGQGHGQTGTVDQTKAAPAGNKIFAGNGPENGHLYEEGQRIVITKEMKYIVANVGAKLSFQLDACLGKDCWKWEKVKEDERYSLWKKDTGKDEFEKIYQNGAEKSYLLEHHIELVFTTQYYKKDNVKVDINDLKSEHEGEYYYVGNSGQSETVKVVIGDPEHPASAVGDTKEGLAGNAPRNGHLHVIGETIEENQENIKHIVAKAGEKLAFKILFDEAKVNSNDEFFLLKKDSTGGEFKPVHTGNRKVKDRAYRTNRHKYVGEINGIKVEIKDVEDSDGGEFYVEIGPKRIKSETVKVVIKDPGHPSSIVDHTKEDTTAESGHKSEVKVRNSEGPTYGDQMHRVHEDSHHLGNHQEPKDAVDMGHGHGQMGTGEPIIVQTKESTVAESGHKSEGKTNNSESSRLGNPAQKMQEKSTSFDDHNEGTVIESGHTFEGKRISSVALRHTAYQIRREPTRIVDHTKKVILVESAHNSKGKTSNSKGLKHGAQSHQAHEDLHHTVKHQGTQKATIMGKGNGQLGHANAHAAGWGGWAKTLVSSNVGAGLRGAKTLAGSGLQSAKTLVVPKLKSLHDYVAEKALDFVKDKENDSKKTLN